MAGSHQILKIVLATILPVLAVLALAGGLFYHQRRKSALFNRGITPIADEEIESWRAERGDEKDSIPERKTSSHHRYTSKDSTGSTRKPPSVVIYHNSMRNSGELVPLSPKSFHNYKGSLDMPPPAVIARAPNARPGLTDETIQGDDAYISPVKRQSSRLAKQSSGSPRHDRSRSARSSLSAGTIREQGQGQHPDSQPTPRHSSDSVPRAPSAHKSGHHRVYSSPDNPPQRTFDYDTVPGGLSPRPVVHKSEIGRAIG